LKKAANYTSQSEKGSSEKRREENSGDNGITDLAMD